MSRLKKLGRAVFLWQQLSYVLFFARSVVFMRLVAPETFGVFALATTLASYMAILRAFDFRAPLITAKELPDRLLSTQYGAETALCAMNFAVSLLLLPWLGGHYGGAVLGATFGLLLVDLVDASCSTPLYLAEREMSFPFISRARAIINIISFGVCALLAWQGFGLVALVVDRLLASLLLGLVMWYKTDWKLSFQWDRASFRYLAGFGGILFLCGMLGKVLFGFDLFMLGTYWSETELGFYSRAIAWARLPMEVGTGFLSMMALAFYSEGARDESRSPLLHYSEMTSNISRVSMWMTGLMAILFWDLVPWVFGARWEAITPHFWALIPYAVARPIYQNCMQLLVSLHEQRFILGVLVVQSALFVLLLMASVGHSPLWIGASSGLMLVLGYTVIERRVHRRLGGSPWRTFLLPLLMLLSVLALAGWFRFQSLNWKTSFALNTLLATLYSGAAFWEWRRNQTPPPANLSL